MPSSFTERRCTRLIYRSEHLSTTWKLRLGVMTILAINLWVSHGWGAVAVAESLVCDRSVVPSDAILGATFRSRLGRKARNLRTSGIAERVLVPLATDRPQPATVALGVADLMARLSRLGALEIVPVGEVEPISLNAARDIRDFMARGGLVRWFSSRRSFGVAAHRLSTMP